MTITYTSIANFSQILRTELSIAEGLSTQPSDVGDHTVTYGYGYTFIRKDSQGHWAIYGYLDADLSKLNITLTDAQLSTLQQIADSLNAGNGGTAAHQQLITDFAQSFVQPDLTLITAQTLFDAEMAHQMAALKSRLESKIGVTAGDAVFQNLQGTREMVAIASLFYNAQSLVGSGLAKALRDGNRAEAWFQIRYGWQESTEPDPTKNPNNGWAKRRYLESTIFGLYNDANSVSSVDAINVYQMLQQHRETILQREAKYGENPDGTSGKRDMIAEGNSNASYQTALNAVGIAQIPSISGAFASAETALFSDLSGKYGQSAGISSLLTSQNFISTNVYVGGSTELKGSASQLITQSHATSPTH